MIFPLKLGGDYSGDYPSGGGTASVIDVDND